MNVTHDIVLLLQNNADFETQYGNIFNEIEKAVDNLTNCSKGKIPGRHP